MHRILYRPSAPEDVQEYAGTHCHGEITNLDQDIRQLGDLNDQLPGAEGYQRIPVRCLNPSSLQISRDMEYSRFVAEKNHYQLTFSHKHSE